MTLQWLMPLFNSSRMAMGDSVCSLFTISAGVIEKYSSTQTQDMAFSTDASSAKGMTTEKEVSLYMIPIEVLSFCRTISVIRTVAWESFPQPMSEKSWWPVTCSCASFQRNRALLTVGSSYGKITTDAFL